MHTWIFQYKSRGIPTNVLLGDGKSIEDIRASKEHDYSMYVVVHAAKKHLNYSKLEDSFQLGGMKDIIISSVLIQ